jgi:hypothetical protein
MSNLISINKGSFLGDYIDAQNNQRIPEEVFFVAGVILTVGLPGYFNSVYAGLIPFLVFASTFLIGAGLGLAAYFYTLPYQIISLDKEAMPEASTSKSDTTKKAA